MDLNKLFKMVLTRHNWEKFSWNFWHETFPLKNGYVVVQRRTNGFLLQKKINYQNQIIKVFRVILTGYVDVFLKVINRKCFLKKLISRNQSNNKNDTKTFDNCLSTTTILWFSSISKLKDLGLQQTLKASKGLLLLLSYAGHILDVLFCLVLYLECVLPQIWFCKRKIFPRGTWYTGYSKS